MRFWAWEGHGDLQAGTEGSRPCGLRLNKYKSPPVCQTPQMNEVKGPPRELRGSSSLLLQCPGAQAGVAGGCRLPLSCPGWT